MNEEKPLKVALHSESKELELQYQDGSYRLSAELLRVMSPSAEVRGHHAGQETLQTGKRDVGITGVEPVGYYALKLIFSDGHDSGLYTWEYLRELCETQETKWQCYMQKLKATGGSRDVDSTSKPQIEEKHCLH